jgi:hypothetical protein|tara:strand:+ start:1260 stop:1805 length:546 start_codon:yes stop_codon:yes gene_type:complete
MADTSQTIQGFYTQAQTKDFARNNLFRVLNINFGTGTEVSFDESDLVYATTASLPGKTITSIPTNYMGLQFNVPGVVQYPGSDNYTIQFRSEESYGLRDKFLQVIEDTFSDADSTGNYFMPTTDAVIDLVLLDKELNRVSSFQLVGVAIREVSAPAYDVTGTGEIVTFDANISYHYFRKTS